ncbi:anthranilate synthase component I family protein [Pseudozobellia sp. WGM2]|uniref:anthranilate synthase component I family protein n=1 Tax=Pseudozobellia sp. WGM2 TaxID=2787625 RepID=UPI001ADEDE30|nr:anthranilate synthase component I family protein [Pseudozobellia sp. WGM2]
MRVTQLFSVSDIPRFKTDLLSWAQQYDETVWLDSNGHHDKYGTFEGLLAVDGLTSIQTDHHNAFDELKEYRNQTNDYIFGYLTYDLKNDLEKLSSKNHDGLEFPELYFFQPKKIIKIIDGSVEFSYMKMVDDEIEDDFKSITEGNSPAFHDYDHSKDIRIKLRTFKDEYFKQVNSLLAHIQHGDIYEANFCQEFYAQDTEINPYKTYQKLNAISRAPFATYLRIWDKHLLCASPERYLRKTGKKVISQPIKGTAKRAEDVIEDTGLKNSLEQDVKERAENIMIVDLVRNDLSKSALKGGVKVEELCKVYSFAQVHQMISTVSAQVAENKNPVDIIKETFPMGSMTGAPKISAMQLIEKHESFKRGLYSGAVGYFSPDGDFDFNVVIRSILYNSTKKYVSFSVGSAITAKAVPEKEYEECLLKAKAMREVLEKLG